MSITHGYVTRNDLKDWLTIDANDTRSDAILDRAVEAASRAIDRYCGRRFYADTVASQRFYRPDDYLSVYTHDISSLNGLVVGVDNNNDGIIDTTWTLGSDYQTEPSYIEFKPITVIRATNEIYPISTVARYTVGITAKWGWPSVPTDIEQACLILAARYVKRKDSPIGFAGFIDQAVAVRTVDPDVKSILGSYRRLQVV